MKTNTIEYIKFWLCAFAISLRITKCRDISKQIASATLDKFNDEIDKQKQINKPFGWVAKVSRRDSIDWVKYQAIYADTSIEKVLELLGTSDHFKRCEDFLTDFEKPIMADYLQNMIALFDSCSLEKKQVIYYCFTTKLKSHDIAKLVDGMTAANVRKVRERFVTKLEKLTLSYENQLPKDMMKEQFELYLKHFYNQVEQDMAERQTPSQNP